MEPHPHGRHHTPSSILKRWVGKLRYWLLILGSKIGPAQTMMTPGSGTPAMYPPAMYHPHWTGDPPPQVVISVPMFVPNEAASQTLWLQAAEWPPALAWAAQQICPLVSVDQQLPIEVLGRSFLFVRLPDPTNQSRITGGRSSPWGYPSGVLLATKSTQQGIVFDRLATIHADGFWLPPPGIPAMAIGAWRQWMSATRFSTAETPQLYIEPRCSMNNARPRNQHTCVVDSLRCNICHGRGGGASAARAT